MSAGGVWARPGAESAWAAWLGDVIEAREVNLEHSWRRVARIAAARGWDVPRAAVFRRRLRREGVRASTARGPARRNERR